ncbi:MULTISPECIES: hypothetical protein [unclassified Kitasatospora]|uniref:hypothetical protein n=1 Tax=unclassified Kitasatospora TaxID=2633591 RepID=UPI0037FFE433
MTAQQAGALPGRLPLIGIYPAAYRASHGEEIAAVFAESVEGADRRTVLREWVTLAAHAARLRTRLSSGDPAGRALAGAAPFLLAGGAALAFVQLVMTFFVADTRFDLMGLHTTAATAVGAVQAAPWVLALLGAGLGHWGAARLLVLVGVLARIGAAVGYAVHPAGVLFLSLHQLPLWLLLGVPLLIAPPDGVDQRVRARVGTVVAAAVIALPMSALVLAWPWRDLEDYSEVIFPRSTQMLLDASSAWPAVVMAIAFFVHFAARRPDRPRAAGVALAALPWAVMLPAPYYWALPRDLADLGRNLAVVVGLLAVAAVLAAFGRTLAASRDPEPVEPA